MLSFKSFIQRQDDDLTPEQFQKKYDEYQLQYTTDVSDHFFESNKCEEWFRDRYDPQRLLQTESETKLWAIAESNLFSKQSIDDPVHLLKSCRLNVTDSGASISPSVTELASGHVIDGHLNRTVYLTSIPAICTRTCLVNSINAALIAGGGEVASRVLLSHPSWNDRSIVQCFER